MRVVEITLLDSSPVEFDSVTIAAKFPRSDRVFNYNNAVIVVSRTDLGRVVNSKR